MPEAPEVEVVRQTLLPVLAGVRLGRGQVSAAPLRIPTHTRAVRRLDGAVVESLGRHGKLLWLSARDGRGALVRLGMTGQLTVAESGVKPLAHTHVRIPLDDGRRELRYRDVRRFGSFVPFDDPELLTQELARLGPDPLSFKAAERRGIANRIGQTQRALKDALLNQRLIAGLGNIYVCEALFLAGLSPWTRGVDTDVSARRALVRAARKTVTDAVKRRGTTFSDFVDGGGNKGDNLHHLWVFGRAGERCRRCRGTIERQAQGSRSTFFCPRCQPG